MKPKVYLNGVYFDEDRAEVPITDRSFLTGEGLFETLRAYQGHVLFLPEHFKRFESGAKVLNLKIPVSLVKLKALVEETLHLNQLSNAVIRIYLTPQGESLGDYETAPKRINLLIACHPFQPFPAEYYKKGVSCHIVKNIIAEKGILSQIKSTHYLSRILARREAKANQAYEGILLNQDGHVTEGASSNLFLVKSKKIMTPPLSEGLMSGVTRSKIFKIAKQDELEIEEKILSPENLFEADEVFITSSLKEVMPVSKIGDHSFPMNPNSITQQILESYHDLIQWEIESDQLEQD